jgi:hypothetical protein
MPYGWSSPIAGLVAILAFLPSRIAPSTGGISLQPQTRVVYVSVTDKNGAALTDMQASEFDVKAGGKTCDIVSMQEPKIPLRIVILDADQGTGAFQLGIARFMQKLLGHAEFELYSVVIQPEKFIDFSHDGRELSGAVSRLGQRGRETGAQLMEAIEQATKDVQHEERRPAILVLRLGGEAASEITGNNLREELRKSGAVLYVVSSAGAQGSAPPQARGTDAVSVQQGQMRDAELAEGQFNLNQVLNDGARESGGRHDQVITTTHAKTVEQVGEELLHQYEIRYAVPDGLKPGDKLSVTTKRKGVTLHAPSRVPG